MSEELKQPWLSSTARRRGRGGTLEMERAVPDGYTIGTYSTQTLTNLPLRTPPSLANVFRREGDVLPGHVDRERQFPRKQPG